MWIVSLFPRYAFNGKTLGGLKNGVNLVGDPQLNAAEGFLGQAKEEVLLGAMRRQLSLFRAASRLCTGVWVKLWGGVQLI